MKRLVQSIVVLSTCAAAVMVQAETAGVNANPGAGRVQAPSVGGEIAIGALPFNAGEVIRAVRENRGLPEEPARQGFHAEARGERPFVSKGNAFSHETPRFQAEIDAYGLRYFAQGSREKPDFEIFSVSFERRGVPRQGRGKSQTVFGKNHLEEHAPGLLQGKARDGVTPYVRNRGEEGVEMYWAIDEPLSSEASALRVHFLIRAAGEPREHPEGLVFPAWQEEGQITLSNVTVADSAGRRERVRPSLATSQEILFEVPHEFLASAQYPILIDPTVGPEFPVEPSPVIGPAADDQQSPSVASNGTDYFVTWHDQRNGTNSDIYGARVAPDGTVLDPAGIAVSTEVGNQADPSAASNGTDYFVAWSDNRSGADVDIYGARVTAAGAVLDPAGIAVSTEAGGQEHPSVASNGTKYFIVWKDWRNYAITDADIYGTRVAPDGTVLDPSGIAVSTAAEDQQNPSVASNGTDYLVAWDDRRNHGGVCCPTDIYGTRVASDGTVLDPAGIAVSASGGSGPSVASNGMDYFIAWEVYDGNIDWDVYGARVASDGTVLDPAGIAISTAANSQYFPSVASNGTDYFIAWQDRRSGLPDIYGARVRASDGLLLDGPPDTGGIAVSAAAWPQGYPSVASNGTDYFVAWEDGQNSTDSDIYGARVASDGTVLDPTGIAVSTVVNNQEDPSVASNGTDYFIAWSDNRSGTDSDIYGTRVALDGTVLDPAGIAVSTEAGGQEHPSVASNGTEYFIAWKDWRNYATTASDIYGTRVAPDGTVLDPSGIAVSTAAEDQQNPSVASNGTDYFVAWEDGRNHGGVCCPMEIYGTRVASDGTVLDPSGIAVSTAVANGPSVASNGTDYFVAWGEYYLCWEWDIYGARVTSAGTVLDPAGIAVSTASNDQYNPSIASNGTDYFIAWQDRRSGLPDIYGARVRASDGLLLDGPPDTGGIAVSAAAWPQGYPSVASNGTDYFVVWEDGQNSPDSDIYGARVTSAAGMVLDPAGILIQQSLYYGPYPAVAYSACGKYLVTYQRFHDDPNIQSRRVMARLFYDGLVPSCIVEEVSSAGSTNSLLVEDVGSGQVKIRWENRGDIMQYNIYEGDLDAPLYNHFPLVCWTAGTDEGDGYLSEIITPVAPNAYYLVTECDTTTEGTPGYDSAGVERDNPLGTCGPHP